MLFTGGECTNALNQSWHVECFVCQVCVRLLVAIALTPHVQYCRKAFTDGAFFEVQGKPFCKLHYHASAGSVCGVLSVCVRARLGAED